MAWRAAAAKSPPYPSQFLQQQEDDDEEAAALSISDQRTLYLVNIFIGNTVRFLNSFSSLCEDKLSQLHRRILHLDATLAHLEAKLEGTCPCQGFAGSSWQETESASSLPLPTNSSSNDRSLDMPFEYGESSGRAANIQKADAATIPSKGSHD